MIAFRFFRQRLVVFSMVALLASPCAAQHAGFPEVEGWSVASDVRTFTAENLWEYINGAAELFLEYEVETCHTGDLAADDLVVTVDYYNMGTPLNAFGVYVRERPDPGISLPGATEALVSPPYQALLLKGSWYVKVNAFEGELTEAAGRSLLEAIARELPGSSDYPEELDRLPKNGLVDGTAGFQREGFLGLAELRDCLYGDYSIGGEEAWQGFVVLPPPESSVDQVWDRLAESWDSLEHEGSTVLYREIPYSGLVGVMKTQRGILGASDATDAQQLIARLERLVR